MNEEAKKLEAIGDGLLLAVARLYLKGRHDGIPYALWTRLTSRMVNNKTLARIAEGEGIHGLEGRERAADALEMRIATLYRDRGFNDVRLWLYSLFDKYVDIEEEARKITSPTEADKLTRQVQGALRHTLKINNGKITELHVQAAAKQIVEQLKHGNNLT